MLNLNFWDLCWVNLHLLWLFQNLMTALKRDGYISVEQSLEFFFFLHQHYALFGSMGVYLYCVFINCDWVLLSFIICICIISSCFGKKCFPKYGFSYLQCQLEPKIGISCLLVSAGEKFGTSSTNLSSFQFQTFVKFMLAWFMHAQQNILTSFHFLQQKTYLHNLKKGKKIHVT